MQENTIKSNCRDIKYNIKHIEAMLENILGSEHKTTIEMHLLDIKNTIKDINASIDRLMEIIKN